MKIDLDPHTFLFSFLKVSVLCLVSASAHWISQKKQLRPSAADQTSDTGDNMMEIFFLVQLNEYFLYFQQVDALMRTSCVLRDWNLKVSLLNCQYLRDPASTPSRRAAVFIVLSFMRCWLPCSKTPLCHTAACWLSEMSPHRLQQKQVFEENPLQGSAAPHGGILRRPWPFSLSVRAGCRDGHTLSLIQISWTPRSRYGSSCWGNTPSDSSFFIHEVGEQRCETVDAWCELKAMKYSSTQ